MSDVVERPGSLASAERGFTYIEVLVASLLMAVVLLAMCGVFIAGYTNLTSAGRSTVALSSARQMIESIRLLPFDAIDDLAGFDTDDSGTLPADEPARELARRWRYALAGEGVGWTFTSNEQARWSALLADGASIGGAGSVQIVAQSATVARVTVSVTVPGRFRPIVLATLVARPL